MIVFGFLPSSDLLQVDLISRTKKVLRSERSQREKASKPGFNEVTQRPSEGRRKKNLRCFRKSMPSSLVKIMARVSLANQRVP